MRKFLTLLACVLIAPSAMAVGGIKDTAHNLSISGKGEFKSSTEDRICIFCHTSHSGSGDAPMWNRRSKGYNNYESSTSKAVAGKQGGSSALCLSCHDGTIALGDMISGKRGQGKKKDELDETFLRGRSNLGTDLSNDHPVAIIYDTDLSIEDPGLLNPNNIDLPLEDNEIQCTSCHDPHSDRIPPFLNKSTQNGELCISCHQLSGLTWSWSSSSHATSDEEPLSGDPWPERKPAWKGSNVRENACLNCHATHNAATPARLVADVEEKTCYRCHDGTMTSKNIRSESQKFFRHPVEQVSGKSHNPSLLETPMTMAFHVECEDCHNPHASRSDVPLLSFNPGNPLDPQHATPPFVNGSLLGVSGIDINGVFKPEAVYEYEVCFKCHGVPGKSACDNRRCSTATTYNMARLDETYNLRYKFDPGNPSLISYHPVESNNPDNNDEVPSLRKDIPLERYTSLIYCSDCHNSSDSPAAGGVAAGGTHGSRFEGILALRYELDPQSSFNTVSGGLCFKCHDDGNLFSDISFPHRLHVVDNNTSCINCHDPHGSAVYPHLINFLTSSDSSGTPLTITGAGMYSQPTWIDNGQYSGTCYLNCHGTLHDGTDY